MSAIAAGRGGLRKTSIIGAAGTDSPKSGGSVTSPVKTFSPPAAKAASPSNAGTTQPAAALRTFGAPKPAAAAASATSPTAAASAPVKAAPVKAAAPAPTPAPKKDEGWQELMTPEGIPYYHNKITNGGCWLACAAFGSAWLVMTTW